ncbi:C40 family peptidase [Undibacterium danionis]|jgi:cell wall-associated NlpC family hydrolase|uniref:C40 family peptidase n=1 Tax=Undibacterium danionis TaxID=1812100 RepID=A0ABV6I997_9BURK
MKKTGLLKICLVLFLVAGNSYASDEVAIETPNKTLSALKDLRDKTSDLTINAMSMLGIKYKRGGNSPENGLDCSGFVRLVFKNSSETELPRTAKEISNKGDKVEPKDLKPGDLVFYNTLKKSFSHVGIYLGDNKFIHSPSAGGRVRIESMNVSYWKKRFNGARRINEDEVKK